MVELFDTDLKQDNRQSSKGNQLKWENHGIWYKADYTGYEGLAEYIISHLLKKSSLNADEYVLYTPEQIRYKSTLFNGCTSRDFSAGLQVITIERLFKNQYGIGLNAGIYALENVKERLLYLVNQVERTTGIKGFGIYLSKLLTLDAVFLNEDRHTHNISVLMASDGSFKLCPIYDNGAALLSDTTLDYPLGINIYDAIKTVKSKTLCSSLEEQLNIAEQVYGHTISFSWDKKDIDELLENAPMYSSEIKERVREILLEQKRKYGYLFNS
ncbi:MAG: hypothetical protein IJL20_14505 [Lachnospiraceae bacterium]|nr:hypothetical protein [Lachnospiraceae bacterium]